MRRPQNQSPQTILGYHGVSRVIGSIQEIAIFIEENLAHAFGNDFDKRHFAEELLDEFGVDKNTSEILMDEIIDKLLSRKAILKVIKDVL